MGSLLNNITKFWTDAIIADNWLKSKAFTVKCFTIILIAEPMQYHI